jgi:hypothetical protein
MIPMLVWTGCFSIGVGQRAETLGKKGWEVGLEPSVIGVASLDGSHKLAGQPKFQLAARYGILDRADVGLRLGTPYFGVTTKLQVTDVHAHGVVVSLGLEAGVIPDETAAPVARHRGRDSPGGPERALPPHPRVGRVRPPQFLPLTRHWHRA